MISKTRKYSVVASAKSRGPRAEFKSGLEVGQINQVRKLAVTIHARKSVAPQFGPHRKFGSLRFRSQDIGWRAPRRVIVGSAPLGLPDRLAWTRFADDLRDADAVVGKHLLATNFLDAMMSRIHAPRRH
jgi:hypothetical protein